MPAKRRTAKRRLAPHAELLAWSGLFRCGYDYFRALDRERRWPSTDTADQSKRAAAPEAWKRLGGAFLDLWESGGLPSLPRDTGKGGLPWALVQFGDPRHAS